MRYLLEQNCPVDHVTGYDLCMFHDLELVRLGIGCGVNILEPDGWASAYTETGSRPLIRMDLCIQLLDQGVSLCWENDDDLMDFRRTIYRSTDARLRQANGIADKFRSFADSSGCHWLGGRD